MSFPPEKKLKEMRRKLEKKEGFMMLPPDADELTKLRFQLCQALLRYAQKNGFTAVEMAEFLEITKADMSRIFNHRIERFSTDRLLNLYAKIKPNYRLKVS